MSARVFVDDWQMQCRGELFSAASTVTWLPTRGRRPHFDYEADAQRWLLTPIGT